MSHELRTPLTSVIGYSEMLLSGLAGDLLPEQREYLATILEKGESLLGLISSILDFSKIEARGVALSLRPTDVSQVLRMSVSTLLPQAQRKKIALTWQSEPINPRPMLDEDRVRQCVVNLLSNAVKFTPEGGAVRARARVIHGDPAANGQDMLDISVQDDGIGIAPDQHDRIFQTFYQVDGSSTREHGGTGLGLAIVRSYVEAHGGYVKVESQLGSGATFSLVFPMKQPESDEPSKG
jgi:signal transduction histidine kinase